MIVDTLKPVCKRVGILKLQSVKKRNESLVRSGNASRRSTPSGKESWLRLRRRNDNESRKSKRRCAAATSREKTEPGNLETWCRGG